MDKINNAKKNNVIWKKEGPVEGVTFVLQVCAMKQLSDGQRSRVSFAWLAWQQPHMLFFDEPTNHLDMESIDALAEAINNYSGGMVLVSHDFRLVHQVLLAGGLGSEIYEHLLDSIVFSHLSSFYLTFIRKSCFSQFKLLFKIKSNDFLHVQIPGCRRDLDLR